MTRTSRFYPPKARKHEVQVNVRTDVEQLSQLLHEWAKRRGDRYIELNSDQIAESIIAERDAG